MKLSQASSQKMTMELWAWERRAIDLEREEPKEHYQVVLE